MKNLLLAGLSPLIFFLFIEGSLALFGVKPSMKDPLVGFAANVPLFVSSGTWMNTAANKLDFFNLQSFPKEKNPGSYRIFSLGGSTTYGRPYDDVTSFSGWLRELLPAADGGRNWEVINAGGISYASYRVAHLMRELTRYQPDLFIVYTGHNEFLEERTYGKLRDTPAVVQGAIALFSRTRLWLAMGAALKRETLPAKVTTILARSAGPERYRRDDALRENVLKHFRTSLQRMVALARDAGAEIVFVAPASNLKDCSPFKSEHTPGLTLAEQQRSDQLLKDAKQAIGLENWKNALTLLDNALAFDPRHAELLYRRGQSLLKLGRLNEAKASFVRARDEDVCPLRALSPMGGILTEVAEKNGVPLVAFMTESSLPGEDQFLDHVHPTIEGNKRIALALMKVMIDKAWVDPGAGWDTATIASVSKKLENGIDPIAHAMALANLSRVFNWAGKSEDARRLAEQALTAAKNDPAVTAKAASVLATIQERNRQYKRALETLSSAITVAPANPELRLKLGLMQLDPPIRKIDKAAGNLLLATYLLPLNDVAHLTFGISMVKKGRVEIAYPSILEANRLNPKNTEAKEYLQKLKGLPLAKPPKLVLESYASGAPRKLVRGGMVVEWHENGRLKSLSESVPNSKISWNEEGKLQ